MKTTASRCSDQLLFKIIRKQTITFLLFLFLIPAYQLSAQVPKGFNYQAIARDASKNPITTPIGVRFTIQSDSLGGTVFWVEEHNSVTPNEFGVFTALIGKGARKSGLASFSDIDWTVTPKFIKTEINNGSWKLMGSSRLWAVPYAMVADSLGAPLKKLQVKGVTSSLEEPLFEVKNNNGQTIFAVYNEGVRIYVDDGAAKGAKGGFSVGGFGTEKGISQSYLKVYPDSVRVYIDETSAKGSKGGFAVGGFNSAKGTTKEFMMLTPANYFIGHNSGKLIGAGQYNATLGYESGKSLVNGSNNIFIGQWSGYTTGDGGSNVLIGTQAGYLNSAGNFNIMLGRQAGYNTTSSSNIFLGDLTAMANTTGYQNVMIGDWAGYHNIDGDQNVFLGAEAGWWNTSGDFNNFMGFQSGKTNSSGSYNSFIGYQAGFNNTTGQKNTYLGYQAGYSGLNASGSNNIYMGVEAGYSNTTGNDNIAIGNKAGRSNQDGTFNIMIGSDAGTSNLTGDYNTVIGYKAGEKTTADYGTMVGYLAGNLTTNGLSQTMIGYEAGSNNTGSYNTFVGVLAGGYSGGGVANTYIGLAAGDYATGSNNVFLGKWAGYAEAGSDKLVIENNYTLSDNLTNALIYGDFATNMLRFNANVGINTSPGTFKLYSKDVTASDDTPAILGEHNVTSFYGIGVKGIGAYIGVRGESTFAGTGNRFGVYGLASGGAVNYGIFGDVLPAAGYAGYFSGNVNYTGTLTNTSDIRLKKNINPIESALNKITSLNGVTFEWKSPGEISSAATAKGESKSGDQGDIYNFPTGKQYGLIAQEVEKVVPQLVQTDAGGMKSVDYVKVVPILVEAVKEQQKQIETLMKEIELLKGTGK